MRRRDERDGSTRRCRGLRWLRLRSRRRGRLRVGLSSIQARGDTRDATIQRRRMSIEADGQMCVDCLMMQLDSCASQATCRVRYRVRNTEGYDGQRDKAGFPLLPSPHGAKAMAKKHVLGTRLKATRPSELQIAELQASMASMVSRSRVMRALRSSPRLFCFKSCSSRVNVVYPSPVFCWHCCSSRLIKPSSPHRPRLGFHRQHLESPSISQADAGPTLPRSSAAQPNS